MFKAMPNIADHAHFLHSIEDTAVFQHKETNQVFSVGSIPNSANLDLWIVNDGEANYQGEFTQNQIIHQITHLN
jgi:hypothetical protein